MDFKACALCGSADRPEVLSGHPTSMGRIVYVRCECGGLAVHLVGYDASLRIAELAGPAGH